MKIFCIYTDPFPNNRSLQKAQRCIESGEKFNLKINLYKSVFFKNIIPEMNSLNIFTKYKPVSGQKTDFKNMTAPETRIANGITHYKLYKQCVDDDESICILEHDAVVINDFPEPIDNGIIQISSHHKKQFTPDTLAHCGRANKMKIHDPEGYKNINMSWNNTKGIISHPLKATNGTSGYIIGPKAANEMMKYIQSEGVAFADRVRQEHLKTSQIYLQVPQSVLCLSDIVSSVELRGI